MPLANFQSPKMDVLEKFSGYIIALWENIYWASHSTIVEVPRDNNINLTWRLSIES